MVPSFILPELKYRFVEMSAYHFNTLWIYYKNTARRGYKGDEVCIVCFKIVPIVSISTYRS